MRRRQFNRGLGAGRVVCAALLTVALSGAARAEGPGIKLGDRLLLHLGLGAEFRYDSNVFYQDSGGTGAFEFRLLPSVDLATRRARDGGADVDFRLHAGMTYNEFITKDSSLASHRSFAFDASALLSLFPNGHFSVDVFDNYVRSTQPPYGPLPYNLDRDSNQLGLRLRFAPGGKRLTIDLTYIFGLDFFEIQDLKQDNLYSNSIALHISWKFFPKTALYLDASELIITYQNADPTLERINSYPFHVALGLLGLITAKLSVNAYVGYGNGFYDSGPSPNTAYGGLNLTWTPTILSTGTLGYRHDFANALVGSYYDVDSVFVNWVQLIWRFVANARVQYSNLRYQNVPPNQLGMAMPPPGMMLQNGSRTDNTVTLDLRVDYPFKPWLFGSLGYDLGYNASSAKIVVDPNAMPPTIVPANYVKHEVWLRLSVLY